MAAKKTRRKTSSKAQKVVKRIMEEFKEGELESGKAGKSVKSQKQAVAIGLSEARKEGLKVAKAPKRKKATKKKAAKKSVKRAGTKRKVASSSAKATAGKKRVAPKRRKTAKRKTAKRAAKRTTKRRVVKRAKA
jgi:hypothetical protein